MKAVKVIKKITKAPGDAVYIWSPMLCCYMSTKKEDVIKALGGWCIDLNNDSFVLEFSKATDNIYLKLENLA